MAVNTYPDGFPKIPLEAVEFSYFLSENEKQEWREWLQTATPDQQDELVDILHSMWQDNQKNAVPESFANNLAQAPVQPQAPTNNFAQQPQFNAPVSQQSFTQPPAQFPAPGFPPANNFAPQQPDFQAPTNNFAQQPQFNAPVSQQSFTQPPAQFPAPGFPPANNFAPQQPDFQAPTNNFAQQPQFNQPLQPLDNAITEKSSLESVSKPEFNDFPDFSNTQSSFESAFDNKQNSSFSSNPESISTLKPLESSSVDFFNPEQSFSSPSAKPDSVSDVFRDNIESTNSQQEVVQQNEVSPEVDEVDKSAFSLDSKGDAALSGSTKTASVASTNDDQDPFKYDEPAVTAKEKKNNNEINIESLVKDNKYTPNPILEDTSAIEDFVYKNSDAESKAFAEKSESDSAKPNPENEIDLSFAQNPFSEDKTTKEKTENNISKSGSQSTKKNQTRDNQNNKKTSNDGDKGKKESFVNFSKLKENDSSSLLGGIYQDYLETSDSNQKKLTLFLERVASVLSNYEQITGHLEDSTAKMMEINDKVVGQAKDIQQLKNATQTATGSSLQEQIDDLRYDIDSLEKEFRSLKTETRRKQNETAEQLAALGADAYKSGGIMQKMELLKVDIMNIQKKIGEAMGTLPEAASSKPTEVKMDENSNSKNPQQDYQNNQQRPNNRFDRQSRGQDARRNFQKQNLSSSNVTTNNEQQNKQTDQTPTKTSNLDLRGIL